MNRTIRTGRAFAPARAQTGAGWRGTFSPFMADLHYLRSMALMADDLDVLAEQGATDVQTADDIYPDLLRLLPPPPAALLDYAHIHGLGICPRPTIDDFTDKPGGQVMLLDLTGLHFGDVVEDEVRGQVHWSDPRRKPTVSCHVWNAEGLEPPVGYVEDESAVEGLRTFRPE